MTEVEARRNAKIGYAFAFSWMFLVVVPVLVPLMLGHGLTMKQFMETQVVFGFVIAVLEVPSGYIADIWGRKNTLIVGSVVNAIGFVLLVFCDDYWDFIFFEALLAVALSLVSGADFSLIYDSVMVFAKDSRDSMQRDSMQKVVAHKHFMSLSSEACSALLAAGLSLISLGWVILANAIAGFAPLVCALFLKEPPYTKMQGRSHFENSKEVFRVQFRQDQLLRLIFFNFVVWNLCTFCAVWILQKYWKDNEVELFWFGVIWAGLQLSAAFVGKAVPYLERRWGTRALILTSGLVPILGYAVMGLSGFGLGVVMGVTFYIARGINAVIYRDAINWRVESSMRATVNSVMSLCFRGSFLLFGPLIGWSMDLYGTSTTVLGLAGVYSVLFMIFLLPLVRKISV